MNYFNRALTRKKAVGVDFTIDRKFSLCLMAAHIGHKAPGSRHVGRGFDGVEPV